jgi:hypothetical protein
VPTRCRILNNVIVNPGGTLIDTAPLEEETIRRNLLWGDGVADLGEQGTEAIVEAPVLVRDDALPQPSADSPAIDAAVPLAEVSEDRLGRERPHGDGPDVGALEVGAPEADPPVVLPPIPPRPVVEPGLYRGEQIHRHDAEAPLAGWDVHGTASAGGRHRGGRAGPAG